MNQPQPERQGDGLLPYDRCPTCNSNWEFVRPAKVSGSNAVRCIECKAVYPLAAPPKPAPDAMRSLHISFADAVCTIEGIANALRHNPKIPAEQIRHDLLLNVRLYRQAADANGIDIRTIKPDDEPYDFGVERDGHAALDRRLAEMATALSAVPSPDGAGEKGINLQVLRDHADRIEADDVPAVRAGALLREAANAMQGFFDTREARRVELERLYAIEKNSKSLSPATGAAEPVAWRCTNSEGQSVFVECEPVNIYGVRVTRLYAAPLVKGDRETVAVPAVAPEPCPCCGGKLHLNGANYSCDKNSSMSFHLDDLSLPVQPGAGEGEALEAWRAAEQARRDASTVYNARLETIRAERQRGNWSMSIQPEFAAIGDAERTEVVRRRELFAALSRQPQPSSEGGER